MTDLKAAYDVLTQHATDTENSALSSALHKLAVDEGWSEKTASEIVADLRL